MRMCVGCREMKPKRELIRVVRAPEAQAAAELQAAAQSDAPVDCVGQITLDPVGKKPGRGAYVCPDVACLQKARKQRGLERAFETRVDAAVYDTLESAMAELQRKVTNDSPLKPAPPRNEPEHKLTPSHPKHG